MKKKLFKTIEEEKPEQGRELLILNSNHDRLFLVTEYINNYTFKDSGGCKYKLQDSLWGYKDEVIEFLLKSNK